MARAKIRKDSESSPRYPWFYTVEYDPPRDDAMEYGSVETHARAIECVEWALTHPDFYAN